VTWQVTWQAMMGVMDGVHEISNLLQQADARFCAAFEKPRFKSHVLKAMVPVSELPIEAQILSTSSACAADRSGTSIGVPVTPLRGR
jgi:hypothetical protein